MRVNFSKLQLRLVSGAVFRRRKVIGSERILVRRSRRYVRARCTGHRGSLRLYFVISIWTDYTSHSSELSFHSFVVELFLSTSSPAEPKQVHYKRMPREDSRVAQANAAVEEEMDYSDEVDEDEEDYLDGEMDTSSRLRQPVSHHRSLLELYGISVLRTLLT